MLDIRPILEMHRRDVSETGVLNEAMRDVLDFVKANSGGFWGGTETRAIIDAAKQYILIAESPPQPLKPRPDQMKVDLWRDELHDRIVEYFEECSPPERRDTV